MTAISFLTPALTAVLAIRLLGEQICRSDVLVLVFSLVGVLLMLVPEFIETTQTMDQQRWPGIFFCLLVVVLLVIYNVNLKKIGEQDTGYRSHMVFGPCCSAALLLPLMYWWWQPLSLQACGLPPLYSALLTVSGWPVTGVSGQSFVSTDAVGIFTTVVFGRAGIPATWPVFGNGGDGG